MSKVKIKYRSLKDLYEKEKKCVDDFLFATVPDELLVILKKLFNDVVNWEKKIQELTTLNAKQKQIVKNIAILKKQLPSLKSIKYWQLLQVLLRFPGNFQMAVHNDLFQTMEKTEFFKFLPTRIHTKKYKGKSLRFFLTDCLALSRLRQEQLKALNQNDMHKSIEIEKHFSIIPNHFLLVEKLKSEGIISIYRGVNIETDQIILVKYVHCKKDDELTENEKLDYKRFEQEAKSFEKLQRYRSKKIDAGERNIDNFFIKAYRLARGKRNSFSLSQDEFVRNSKANSIEFMVMRYIDGVTLEDLLKEYRQKNIAISLKVIMYILDGLLQTLDYCHKENITHRDICPRNILITKKFEVRLTSLGWAALDMNQTLPKWSFIGSDPGYVAPEGIFQKEENITDVVARTNHRFDLYSVGCIAYQMLVGHLPFIATTQEKREILQKHLGQKPFSLVGNGEEISEKLNNFVLKLLAKNPAERYANPTNALLQLHKSFTLTQKANAISHNVLTKTPQQTQEFNLSELPINTKKRSFLFKLIVIMILLSPCLYYYRTQIISFSKAQFEKYHQYSAYNNLQTEISKFYDVILRKVERCDSVVYLLENKYPSLQGYPQPSNRVLNILKAQKQYLKLLQYILNKGKQKKENSLSEAATWTSKYKNYRENNYSTVKMLDRLFEKLTSTQRIAKSLRTARDEEKMMRRTYRLLQSHIVKTEEQVDIIEEKLVTLAEQFPTEKGYLPVDKYIRTNIEKAKKSIQKYENVVSKITEKIATNQFGQAIKIAMPYNETNKEDLEYLIDTNEAVGLILSSSRNLYKERQQRRVLDKTFVTLQERIIALSMAVKNLKNIWREVKTMSIKTTSPNKLFLSAKQEIKNLKTLVKTVNKHLDEAREEEAIELLEKYNTNTSLTDLVSLKEQFVNSIRIAKAPKSPKVDKQIIISFLSVAKTNLSELKQADVKVDKHLQYLQEEFDKEKYLGKKQETFLQNAKNNQKSLYSLISQAEEQLKQDKLLDVLGTLRENRVIIRKSKNYVGNLNKLAKYLQAKITTLQKKKKKQRLLAQTNRMLNRLSNQKMRLEQSIFPVNKRYNSFIIRYPAKKGYTQVDSNLQSVLVEAKSKVAIYQSKITKANILIKEHKYLKTIRLLKSLENQNHLALFEKLKKLEEKTVAVEELAKVEKFKKQKNWKMRKLITLLENRKQEIDTLIPRILTNLSVLNKYNEQDGYMNLSKQSKKYVLEVKGESKELHELIKEAKELFQNKQYADMQELLTPYIENPAFSRLQLLKLYMKNTTQALAKNEKLKNNDSLRMQRKQQYKINTQKKNNLKKWQKSPGNWHNQILNSLSKYEHLPIQTLLKDKGSLFIRQYINTSIIKIRKYPFLMAELQELVSELKNLNKTIKAKNTFKQKKLQRYLSSQSIEIQITEEMQKIENSVYKLQEEIKRSWIEEETLRNILRNLNSVSRKFNEEYIAVKSILINLKYN